MTGINYIDGDKITMEILCCADVCLMVSLTGAALLQSRALCGSCREEGHSDRHILYLRMKKSKDVLLFRKSGRNSCECSK